MLTGGELCVGSWYRGGYVPTLLQSGFNVESHRARLLGVW